MDKVNCYTLEKIYTCYQVHLMFEEQIDGKLEINDEYGLCIIRENEEPFMVIGNDIAKDMGVAWCDRCELIDQCPVQIGKRWRHFGELQPTHWFEDRKCEEIV